MSERKIRTFPKLWVSPAEAVFSIAGILFLIGTVNVFSASFVLGGQLFQNSYFFVIRHLISFSIGFFVMLVFAFTDYRKLQRGWLFLAIIMTVGLLVAVHVAGADANGARRWLSIAGFKFQPSEIAKLTAIMVTAAHLGAKLDRGRMITLYSLPLFVTLIFGVFVLKQPDMGTAAVIVGISLMLYVLAGIPRRELYVLGMAGVGMTVYLVYAAAYRAERIWAWLDPWSYQQTTGYQTVQSLLAIGSGGFWGSGLGMGASKFHYLPEAHTDFAFAVLSQEMGFVGAVLVLLLFGALAWYGIQIASRAADGYGFMLATGITALIVGQAVGNIAMVSGVIPVTGVPLPFISFGGTSLIVNCAAIGLLISVGRRMTAKVFRPGERRFGSDRPRLKLVKRGPRPASV
ncbi:FtsW/RodA/SpoVE family cell cycle protein [Sporomusa acidovorans]|uniref:Probable peptidoglycan glycosyltransferase FtsW n=1 Tax=Sporomusa acidovorans (strain ATCC 49682 / DSM 3132 / Mol) TaxID=1123286 RepID=A0ABZ3JBZ0_SPOA4|nr:putative peptidoglycan glycosyltransferase FtsW [Sporomusa acidovorans]OZC13288.1 lipid II flippase FtsW [Sporomusa acidovorans DSM 3132]SDD98142.1 cell division protein FtsW [Sporomusa acidovorans]